MADGSKSRERDISGEFGASCSTSLFSVCFTCVCSFNSFVIEKAELNRLPKVTQVQSVKKRYKSRLQSQHLKSGSILLVIRERHIKTAPRQVYPLIRRAKVNVSSNKILVNSQGNKNSYTLLMETQNLFQIVNLPSLIHLKMHLPHAQMFYFQTRFSIYLYKEKWINIHFHYSPEYNSEPAETASASLQSLDAKVWLIHKEYTPYSN